MNIALAAIAQSTPTTVDQVINVFWQAFAQNLNSALGDRMEVPINISDIIGDEGVTILATRLSEMIGAPVTTVEDVDRNVIQIVPSRFLLGHNSIIDGAKKPKAKALKEDKVARPPNAFILYRQHHHPLVKASHPELHNNQISVILGTQWKEEKESTKARYINLAQKLKVKHFLEHPDYQYQPRKPSEKKRRMTRRKAAALAESEQTKSSSAVKTTFASVETPITAEQSTAVIPDLHKTPGGNAELELGDETLDDEAFAAMLEKYNQSIPPANTPTAVRARNDGKTAVMYDEPSEAAQTDANFYSSVFDYNPFAGNEELGEGMHGIMTSEESYQAMMAAVIPNAPQMTFDEQNETLFDAELARMEKLAPKLGEWSYVFEPEM